jgi:hypothetical protein
MATIEVVGWKKDFEGFTAWDTHKRSELRRRLRAGVRASQACIKRLAGQLDDRQSVCIDNVHEDAVHGLTQILEASGAELRVSLQNSNDPKLFKRIAKR